MDKTQKKALAAAIIIVVAAIVGTVYLVKNKNKPESETTTVATTEATTKATYVVDLEYVEKMISEKRFTDSFETYKAGSYSSSSKASKDAYWAGIQQGNTVNPLLLAATSSYLNSLGFDMMAIKPSELYNVTDDGAYLNAKGEEVLKKVKEFIYSDETKVFTSDLGSSASKLYNSSSSNEKGIVYASRVGITGNTACWVITTQNIDLDAQFDNILEIEQSGSSTATTSKNGSKAATAATIVGEGTLVQLCRCGNTVTENPPKEEPTTEPTTKKVVTTEPTTKVVTTTEPTTKVVTTTEPTTKKVVTTEPTTKNKQQDPVNQGNAQRGGGSKRSAEDTTATTRYDPVEPTMPTSVRKVTTTVPSTTKPTTTAPSTTKPATTKPSTTAPKAEPTHVESNTYVDKKTGETTVVNDDTVVTGSVTRPKR